jgi:hypothetical protein
MRFRGATQRVIMLRILPVVAFFAALLSIESAYAARPRGFGTVLKYCSTLLVRKADEGRVIPQFQAILPAEQFQQLPLDRVEHLRDIRAAAFEVLRGALANGSWKIPGYESEMFGSSLPLSYDPLGKTMIGVETYQDSKSGDVVVEIVGGEVVQVIEEPGSVPQTRKLRILVHDWQAGRTKTLSVPGAWYLHVVDSPAR